MSASATSLGRLLVRDLLPILMIAYAVFLGLRSCAADRYRVRSSSMEPSLFGHPETGDVLLVDKSPWARRRPERHDLVVVRPESGDPLPKLKRVAALGPADLRINHGDVFVAPPTTAAFRRLQKDPRADADLRVPLFCAPALGPQREDLAAVFHLPRETRRLASSEGVLELRAGVEVAALRRALQPARRASERARGQLQPLLPGLCCTQRPIDTSYLDRRGARVWRDLNYYPDFGIDCSLQIAAGDPARPSLVLVHEYRDQDIALLLDLDGQAVLLHEGRELARQTFSPPAAGALLRLCFGYLDGRAFLLLDGAQVLLQTVPLRHPDSYHRANALHFGLAGQPDARVRIRCLELFRDISISSTGGGEGPDGVYRLPAEHMFLLGDNTQDSTDSRGLLGTVHISRILGRPRYILAPADRRRSLAR